MKTLRNINKKNITYESAYGELTNKDQEKILKLARKIEKGKGIAEKFKNGILRKSHYNTKRILVTKITYGDETFTLLDHAKLYENNQAISDILQEAKKQKLSENILSVKANMKHYPIEITTDVETTTTEDENSEKILDPNTAAMKTLSLKFGAVSTDDNDINKSSEDLDNIKQHRPVHENNEKAPTSAETTMQEISQSSIEVITESQVQPCFDSGSGKENIVNKEEETLTKTVQQRRAIIAGSAGAVLLAISAAYYVLKMPIIAVIGGIIGLMCISFALYNVLKPSTKLEKVEKAETLLIQKS
ncbi:MAG: hypothetical protein ACR5K9_04240 [Wolbachia sp.]